MLSDSRCSDGWLDGICAQLMHPILGALDGTPHEWIKKLLLTFNEGSIGRFEALAPLFPREVRGDRSWIGNDAS